MCLSIEVRRPNDVLARGEHAGFQWRVIHNTMGFRCGYVKVPQGHPWHGKNYNDIPADVHGGLTFAEHDEPCAVEGAVDDGYWVGFDCGHYMDAPDPTLPTKPTMNVSMFFRGNIVRDQAYVEGECRRLCDQAKAAA